MYMCISSIASAMSSASRQVVTAEVRSIIFPLSAMQMDRAFSLLDSVFELLCNLPTSYRKLTC